MVILELGTMNEIKDKLKKKWMDFDNNHFVRRYFIKTSK